MRCGWTKRSGAVPTALILAKEQLKHDRGLAKEFYHMVELWFHHMLQHGESPPESWNGSEEDYFRAKFALLLGQNEGRCGDGLSLFIRETKAECSEVERQVHLHYQDPSYRLGKEISRALKDYKEKFMKNHKMFFQGIEQQTEGDVLLHQRLRLPLGLSGTFYKVLYPSFGQTANRQLKPKHITRRFLEGGILTHGDNTTHIPKYTPQLLISLIKEQMKTKPRLIQDGFINRDAELKSSYEDAWLNMVDNEWVAVSADPAEGNFTDALYEKLLVRYGYLNKL